MMHNFEVERRNVERYKNSLVEIDREQLASIDRVKELENKESDLEATKMALTEINERLTNECSVKDGEFRSVKRH